MSIKRSSLLVALVATAVLFQTVLAGWGHSHCHHGVAGKHAEHDHSHRHKPADDDQQPTFPADEEGCTLCRLLAESPLVEINDKDSKSEVIATAALAAETPLRPTLTVGLRRPRSPPELG